MALVHSPKIVTDNLVLCLDAASTESDSTTMKDVIGNNDATNIGSTFVAATSNNPAYYSLDGSNDYLQISSPPNSIIQFGTDPYTVELWFNIYYDDQLATIIDTRNNSSDISSNWRSLWSGKQGNPESTISRKLNFGTIDQSNNFWGYSTRFDSNQYNGWMQVVFTREGTGQSQQKMYWDGGYVYSDMDSSDYDVAADDLDIGRDSRIDNLWFKGYIAIVRIYNGKALTAAEIKQNYNAHKGRFGL